RDGARPDRPADRSAKKRERITHRVKGRVERAVEVEPRQEERVIEVVPGNQDLAVLDRYGIRLEEEVCSEDDFAAGSECKVRCPVGVVAGQGDCFLVGPRNRVAGDNDLAVVLNGHGPGHVVAAEIRYQLAVTGKAGVERSVWVVAGHGEVVRS